MTPWDEVADRVWVRRYDPFDVNVTVVAGDERVLLVDTRGTVEQARQVRRHLGQLPVAGVTDVVITHAHLDHCLGTAAFGDAAVWGSRGCARWLGRDAAADVEEWLRRFDDEQERERIRASPVVPPRRTVSASLELDLGGRGVELAFLGRGHTDHDLVVVVDDGEAVLAGDLVEVGAPPMYGDAHPFAWPATLARMSARGGAVTVPGHGAPTDAAFVATQLEEITELARLCRELLMAQRGIDQVVAASPFPEQVTRDAIERAYATG